jgi:Putative peptidoglycan binding domain
MRSIKGTFAGLVLAGILAIAPTAAFAHGGGGGGHIGGGHFGGGHIGGGHFAGGGHFNGGGRHFGGFAARGFGPHGGGHFSHGGHFRHGGQFFFGGPYWDSYPYDDYYDFDDGDYSDAQSSSYDVPTSGQIVIAVQTELAKLGYYHGQIDGVIGSETEKAISWFQSVEKLTVTGRIDDPTLNALQIS